LEDQRTIEENGRWEGKGGNNKLLVRQEIDERGKKRVQTGDDTPRWEIIQAVEAKTRGV